MKVYMGIAGGSGGESPKIPLAKTEAERVGRATAGMTKRPLRLLLSYHYYRDEDLATLLKQCFGDMPLDIFADSGAYSAWTTGATITVKEYADWLGKWGSLFSAAAALDVIGDAQASVSNTIELRKVIDPKLEIVPVFHANDGSWDWLKRYFDLGYTYVGLAPNYLRRAGAPKLVPAWLKRCFQMQPENVRYHGFAVTGWKLMRDYPWYSVDSSSWTAGFRYAQLQLFDDRKGRMVQVAMGDRKDLLSHADLLKRYNIRPSQMQAKGYDRDLLCAVSVESWQRAEEWLERKHGGPRVHLATSADSQSSGGGHVASVGKGVRAYLSASANNSAPNHPVELGRVLRKDKS